MTCLPMLFSGYVVTHGAESAPCADMGGRVGSQSDTSKSRAGGGLHRRIGFAFFGAWSPRLWLQLPRRFDCWILRAKCGWFVATPCSHGVVNLTHRGRDY